MKPDHGLRQRLWLGGRMGLHGSRTWRDCTDLGHTMNEELTAHR